MHVRKLAFLALVLSLPTFAFAEGFSSYLATLMTAFQNLLDKIIFLIGFGLFVVGGYKLKLISDEQQKNAKGSAIAAIFVGAVMMNSHQSLSVMINTYFKADYCTVIDNNSVSNSCFSDEISGLTGELKNRIERISMSSTAQEFMDRFMVLIGIFQAIGFIYFFVGAYGIYQVANGSSQDTGYGKSIVTMTASSLIVALPHTVQTVVSTLNGMGINL